MPIYEYVCRSCGHELEQLQRLSDDSLTDCPECAEPQLKRKISAAGFRLSGGGWYETDFKSDGKRNLAGGEDKSASGSSASKKDSASDTNKKPSKTETSSPKTDKPKDKKPAKADSKPASSASS
ncbi:hypothetical protein SADO_15529 [Salinisphaera dokdonensis CL-ES53]|uniref:Putative regulatory protein FmdB zinc ribbon domain-containing protein n=1 Tax=Salinisphaera dokdonensis CL-ES53 TaxID=1304272 RepID=A0ABV2B464_9GAMM